MYKGTIIIVLFLLTFSHLKAQNLETILLAKDDAAKLTNAYLNPVMKGLIYSMNKGWYHTAKVHKKFGFDITIEANASFVPSKDELFNVTKLGLSANTKVLNGVNNTPTILGDDGSNVKTSKLRYINRDNSGVEIGRAEFTLPRGKNLPVNAIPAPSVQVGIGLPYKLEAMVRFLPKMGSDDAKGSLFGIGIKKEITDWFGPMGKTPFHISLLAAYTSMNVDYTIDDNAVNEVSTKNTSAEFKLNSYTVQAIASFNLPIINFYGGLGYNGGTTKLNMLGTYSLRYSTPPSEDKVTDPLTLKTNSGNFNATVGTRLSLGFFKIFGSYTVQEYNSVSVGIAFSFR